MVAGGESILREGRNALVGPLVLPAWKWNEGKGQGPVSLPQWGGGASGAGGENTSREGRNALVGPLVLPAWKWNEGEGAGSGLRPSVGRRRQWGRWREHFKGGTECSGGSLGASCVEVERGGRGKVRPPSLSGEAAPLWHVARAL